MNALVALKAFDVDAAEVTLWTFKKQTPKGQPPKYNGHWVNTTPELDQELKTIVKQQRASIAEQQDYGLLTQNNEASALHISADETHAGLLAEQFSEELAKHKVKDIKTLRNCVFYIIKLDNGQDVLYCAKKTDTSWKTKTSLTTITAIFSDKQLDVTPDNDFRIFKSIDFFGIGEDILIKNKENFESILSYKEAHEKDYAEMCAENEFKNLFSDLGVLTSFVGVNKINLRRMSAIRQKGFYADKKFMENLRKSYKQYNLNLEFDPDGRFLASLENCRDIISALLDHRLISGFSGNIYDVQDAVPV